jgi:small nuclear ribonucleoprotein (snRNP)-like protein
LFTSCLFFHIKAPFFVEKKNDKDFEARLNALDELLNTERAYISDLRTVIEKYLIPIRKGSTLELIEKVRLFKPN